MDEDSKTAPTSATNWGELASRNLSKGLENLREAIEAAESGEARYAANLATQAIAPLRSAAAFQYVARVENRSKEPRP